VSVNPVFHARPFLPQDLPSARELARACGLHGVYVANHLLGQDRDGAELLSLHGSERLLGVCLFGARGNLVILQREPLDGDRVARAVRDALWSWRIVLGPRAVVRALARTEPNPPLVLRRQVYFGMQPQDAPAHLLRDDVRAAVAADRESLMTASLELNRADLKVDPRRVHRAWLRETVQRRIDDGSTQVLGAPGDVQCKLDLGSTGPLGLVIEGVFTRPECRGRGLAASLVATVAARARGKVPLVLLHVAAANDVAQRAYRRAGMEPRDDCELMLRA
jgi:GNAT superfamily N-acetyltransferase